MKTSASRHCNQLLDHCICREAQARPAITCSEFLPQYYCIDRFSNEDSGELQIYRLFSGSFIGGNSSRGPGGTEVNTAGKSPTLGHCLAAIVCDLHVRQHKAI